MNCATLSTCLATILLIEQSVQATSSHDKHGEHHNHREQGNVHPSHQEKHGQHHGHEERFKKRFSNEHHNEKEHTKGVKNSGTTSTTTEDLPPELSFEKRFFEQRKKRFESRERERRRTRTYRPQVYARMNYSRHHRVKGEVTEYPIDSDYYDSECDSEEIVTASMGLLDMLAKKVEKQVTGDSEYYDRLNYDSYMRHPLEPSKSISSDYSTWEREYEEMMARNTTTEHYAWWTYDPTESVDWFRGKPWNVDRALYSLKMSSMLPANVSAELDAEYNHHGYIDRDYAKNVRKEQKEWAATMNLYTNAHRGPIEGRRELEDWHEILGNRVDDKEYEMANKLEKDFKHYVREPLKKGLFHLKKWLNPKYYTTTLKVDLTWPLNSDTKEYIKAYKHYLARDKNITLGDSAGESIFERYTFTADSNYYHESKEELPEQPSNVDPTDFY